MKENSENSETRYYLIKHIDISPNELDSQGHYKNRDGYVEIVTEPGRKNLSGEICTDGWLGSFNDLSSYALGEFETLDEARAAAHAEGYTEPDVEEDEYLEDEEDGFIESWITKKAASINVSAADWLLAAFSRAEHVCSEYGITADSTDEDLDTIYFKMLDEADNEDTVVHGLWDFLEELRSDMIQERERDAELDAEFDE